MAVVREATTIPAVIGVGVDETLSLSDLFGQFEKGNVMLSVVETSPLRHNLMFQTESE